MAVIHDMMAPYELFQPTDVEEAVALLNQYGRDAWPLAGGMDSLDWFKDRVKTPRVVVDLSAIDSMRGIRPTEDGLEIGALTPLTQVSVDPTIRERFGVLAEAAGLVASPQIRNQGTIGGNIAQDTRCWYYRSGWPCYRAGGNVCYAATPTSLNREHAILGADRCVAVSPSDTAPALVALDARMVVRNGRGEREIPAERFFMTPGTDITRMTVLGAGDLLTAIRIPNASAGKRFYFEKVADRKSWDFPLVNIAAAFTESGGTIEDARIVVGAVAARPLRLHEVERAVVGRPANDETAAIAGDLAVQGAKTLRQNEYKVALMKNLVKRAIRAQEA